MKASKMPQDELALVSTPLAGKKRRAVAKRKNAEGSGERSDPRFQPFVEAWFNFFKERGEDYALDGRDFSMLKRFLRSNPKAEVALFAKTVREAFANQSKLSGFLREQMQTLRGFLDRYQTIKATTATSSTSFVDRLDSERVTVKNLKTLK